MRPLTKLLVLACIFTTFQASAQQRSGGQRGRAGGGVSGGGALCGNSDGSVGTISHCLPPGAPIANMTLLPPAAPDRPFEINDQPTENPEGLSELIRLFSVFPYFEDDFRAALLASIRPTSSRKYIYTSAPPEFTREIRDRILGQFRTATGLDPRRLVLFGLTDTRARFSYRSELGRITYLLPPFRNLRTLREKVVALWHESFWARFPNATYEEVVRSELALEAALEVTGNPAEPLRFTQDAARLIAFVESTLGTSNSHAARERYSLGPELSPRQRQLLLLADLQSGALQGLVDVNGRTTNLQLFGAENIRCFQATLPPLIAAREHARRTCFESNRNLDALMAAQEQYTRCVEQFGNYATNLRRQYPRSHFLAALTPAQNYDMAQMIDQLSGFDYRNAGARSRYGDDRSPRPLALMRGALMARLGSTQSIWIPDRGGYGYCAYYGSIAMIPTGENIVLQLFWDGSEGGPIRLAR